MTSTPDPVDERLLAAHDLALAALREITSDASIGAPAGYLPEEGGVVSLRFENRLPGYPGWYWTVSVARVDDAEPTVLEVELLPGDGALLAPEWVPWAVRLAEYQATQAALAEAAETEGDEDDLADDEDESDDDLEDDDESDDEDDDLDVDGSSILHAGDVDGVDIDELDAETDDSDEGEDAEGDLDDDSDDEDDLDDGDDDEDDLDDDSDDDDSNDGDDDEGDTRD